MTRFKAIYGDSGATGPPGPPGPPGSTLLSGLDDVGISAPANGHILRYNSVTSKWENVSGSIYQPLDSDLTAIAALTPSNDDVIQRKAGAWTNRTPAQLKTDLVLVKGDVGLGNVDNTSDATKNAAAVALTNKDLTSTSNTFATATTTAKGPVELATDAEAITGTDPDRATTPKNIAAVLADRIDTNVALGASNTKVPSQAAVKAYADGLLDANNAYQYKGGIDCSANPNYPAASAGHTYKVTVAGKIGGASGPNVEVGDTLTCLVDGTISGNHATVGANWLITQTNIDGAVTGPASSVAGNFASFAGSTGKVIQDAGVSLDTDATMAANSDGKVPSQKAVKTAVALKADDTAVVHKSGAETVTGIKTFDAAPVQTYQGSTPATPASGHATGPYFGADGLPYFLTPTGVVVPISIGDIGTALHSNASFETVSGSTPTVWNTFWQSGGSFTTETTDVAFGTRSATVSTTAGANFQHLISDVFTVAGGDLLTIAAWAHKITGNPKLTIGILTGPSGTPDFFDGVSRKQSSDSFVLATAFTKYSKTFPIPADHTVARLFLLFEPSAAEATSSRVDFTTSVRTGASTAILPGNSWVKETCRVATTSNVSNLATGAPSTMDGVSLGVGDRVLVINQTTLSQNGIYAVTVVGTGSNGTWVRASDALTSLQLAGAATAVSSGTAFAGSRWGTSFKAADTVGTSVMIWSREDVAPGTIELFSGGSLIPNGWFVCNGAAISRTTYAALFALIGTSYGAGDGSTTFNIPDLRDRFPVGSSGTKAVASTGGAATHTHPLSAAGWAKWTYGFWRAVVATLWTPTNNNNNPTGAAASTNQTVGIELGGATDSASTLPPYLALTYMIKT